MNPVAHFQTQLTSALAGIWYGPNSLLQMIGVALLCRGHLLLEGVPGLGKTFLARTLAQRLGGTFRRVQGTSDLLPSDLTGVSVWRPDQLKFEFVPGPLFAQVLLVDEINRAGPRTQSALLEAMEERQITVERSRYALPSEFLVLASQNPQDFEGTYPLPESQLDRFFMKLVIGYLPRDLETEVVKRYLNVDRADQDGTVEALPATALSTARQALKDIVVSQALVGYVLDLAHATRNDERVRTGISTRAALALIRAARAYAGTDDRDFVLPDDVKQVAHAVLGHRLRLSADAELDGVDAATLLQQVLERTPVPRVDTGTA